MNVPLLVELQASGKEPFEGDLLVHSQWFSYRTYFTAQGS